MSKVSQLIGKGETLEFETESGKVEILIKPLKNKELLELIDIADRKDNKSMLRKMLLYTLRKDDGSVTEDEIEELETPFIIEILKMITKVNRLEGMLDFHQGGPVTNPPVSKSESKAESIQKLKAHLQQNR